MKIAAVICNIVLVVFHCFVLLTDGFPRETSYIIFNLWALLTMILSVMVILRFGTSNIMGIVAIIFNIVFFGFVCWALVDQYPHPKEGGVIAMAILMVLTPILNLVVLLQKRFMNCLNKNHPISPIG
jgi:hypothetical protein